MRSISFVAAAAFLSVAGVALAQDASQGYQDAMQKMMSDMSMKPMGDADKDFAMMMLPHHRGAVDMAKVELQYGKDPTLLEMAKGIVAAQEKEIAELEAWHAKHK